jgi:PAS domain-containing protein
VLLNRFAASVVLWLLAALILSHIRTEKERDQALREKVDAKEALRESENRYTRLVENAKDIIYRMSLPEGSCMFVNPASIDKLGYSQDELCNSQYLFKKVIHPDCRVDFEKLLLVLLANLSAKAMGIGQTIALEILDFAKDKIILDK